jgi:hypothetical protein
VAIERSLAGSSVAPVAIERGIAARIVARSVAHLICLLVPHELRQGQTVLLWCHPPGDGPVTDRQLLSPSISEDILFISRSVTVFTTSPARAM